MWKVVLEKSEVGPGTWKAGLETLKGIPVMLKVVPVT